MEYRHCKYPFWLLGRLSREGKIPKKAPFLGLNRAQSPFGTESVAKILKLQGHGELFGPQSPDDRL